MTHIIAVLLVSRLIIEPLIPGLLPTTPARNIAFASCVSACRCCVKVCMLDGRVSIDDFDVNCFAYSLKWTAIQ